MNCVIIVLSILVGLLILAFLFLLIELLDIKSLVDILWDLRESDVDNSIKHHKILHQTSDRVRAIYKYMSKTGVYGQHSTNEDIQELAKHF